MSDSVFFIASKFLWAAISPDSLLAIFLVLCIFLFWFKRTKKAMVLLHVITCLVLLITLMPLGQWCIYSLEKQFPSTRELPRKVDGVIMLGGPEYLALTEYWQQPQLAHGTERYLAFMSLMKKYPKAKHVFAGGSGKLNQNGLKAADVARMVFAQQGFDVKNIFFESKSRNTYENALNAFKLIRPEPEESWILITTASHMPRSIGVFYQLNWHVIPFPVDYQAHPEQFFDMTINFARNLSELKSGLYAWVGLAAYYFTGKTPCFLPSAEWIEQHPL